MDLQLLTNVSLSPQVKSFGRIAIGLTLAANWQCTVIVVGLTFFPKSCINVLCLRSVYTKCDFHPFERFAVVRNFIQFLTQAVDGNILHTV